jgi:hypothetical protein
MQMNFRLLMVYVFVAIVLTRFVTGCKSDKQETKPSSVSVQTPQPQGTQTGSSTSQPAVPDAAEPSSSQVQFK